MRILNNSLLKNIKDIKIGVIGDIMLDKYILGYSERISPEAPVPIIKLEEEDICLGGAGNVVANVSCLGASVFPIGYIGNDSNGNKLKKLFHDINASMDGLNVSESMCTTTKTRIIANGQQVVRVDNEDIRFDSSIESILIKCINDIVDKTDLMIISDYGKGICSQKVLNHVISKSNILGKPVLIDPCKTVSNFDDYRNCTIITPNFYEARSLLPNITNNDKDITKSAKYISTNYDINNVMITRGSKGISVLSNGDSIVHLPTQAREVFDVSGAGDTVIASMGVCFALGLDLIQSAEISNVAAGIVISQRGTTPIKIHDLKERLKGYNESGNTNSAK